MVEKGTKISRMIQPENCKDIIEKNKKMLLLQIEDIKKDAQLSQEEKDSYIKKLLIELENCINNINN